MEYNKSTMLNRKNGYIDFSLLFNSIYSYEYNSGDLEDNLSTIDYYCLEVVDELLLPSNRFGTPLAVALETHCFKTCLYMLKNHERLGISLNNLLEGENGKHINLIEEFDFILSYYSVSEEERKLDMFKKFVGDEREKEERIHLKEELQALDEIKEIVKNYKTKKSRNI